MSGRSRKTTESTLTPDDRLAGPPVELATLVEVLRWRAESHGDDPAFTFLLDGEREEESLTYRQLVARADRVAAELVSRGAVGSPVVLVFDPGLDYLTAFLGCLMAGAIAVPVYPPDPFRLQRTIPRLRSIIDNAGTQFTLASDALIQGSRLVDWLPAPPLSLDAIGLDIKSLGAAPGGAAAGQLVDRGPRPEAPALLQYTSGSTGTPRGVTLTHDQLMQNFRMMHEVFDVERAVLVQWLPPYHDMGLIGCTLLPLHSGRHTVAMSPLAFVQRPARWLRAIDRFRATTSGAPNFGFELCIRKIRDEECEGLDLSCWKLAVCGAEPVRASTLRDFSERFGRWGFEPRTFVPSYGMAETTLCVTAKGIGTATRTLRVAARSLEQNLARPAADGEPERELVSCGRPIPRTELLVVDPDRCVPLEPGQVGELWVRSASVGLGYWRNPEATEATFHGRLADSPLDAAAEPLHSPAPHGSAHEMPPQDGHYLRTGDLGFLDHGELFITGRRKELIILAGRNLYPLDLERAIQDCHPDLKVDGGAAFTVEHDGEERLVVVQELLRPARHDLPALLRQCREAIASEAGLAPFAVVLIAAGSLPKTSSGKIQRAGAREAFLGGALLTVAAWPEGLGSQPLDNTANGTAIAGRHAAPRTPPRTEWERQVAAIWEEVLGLSVCLEDDFFQLGGQSLRATAMLGRVAAQLGRVVPLSRLFEHPRLSDFAAYLERAAVDEFGVGASGTLPAVSSADTAIASAAAGEPGELDTALSVPQRRFWYLERHGAGGARLHIPVCVRLHGHVSADDLVRGLRAVCGEHDILRMAFVDAAAEPGAARQDEPRQRVVPLNELPEVEWERLDVRGLEGEAQAARVRDWRRRLVERPFDLRRPPLLRAGLVQLADEEHELVLVLHHITADGWSVGVLLRDLARCSAPTTSSVESLNALQESSRANWRREFANWQEACARDSRLSEYWRRRLEQVPTLLELPDDSGLGEHAAAGESEESYAVAARLGADESQAIIALANAHGATPFMVQLGVFQSLLARYTGQRDLCVGTVVANRVHPALERTIGCFINTVPLRADLGGDPTFVETLARLRSTAPTDLEHASYPFEQLVEDARPRRAVGRLPLLQAMYVHQDSLAPPQRLGGARVVGWHAGTAGLAEFDVALVHEPHDDGSTNLQLSFRPDRLHARTARRMLDNFVASLRAIVANPAVRLSELPLAPVERAELLSCGEGPRRAVPDEGLAQRIARQVEQTPDAIAIECEGESWTYQELDRRARRVATICAARGVGSDVPVGLLLRRTPRLLEAILGVLYAGGAYVPLDPAYPAQRIAKMVSDCDPPLVICENNELRDSLPGPARGLTWAELDETPAPSRAPRLPVEVPGESLAYVIYTSGTTGEPKGVMIPRRAVANFVQSFGDRPGMRAGDRVLAHTTVGFDISVLELVMPLAVGATVVLAPCGASRDGRQLRAIAEWAPLSRPGRPPVDLIQSTPSGFRVLLAAGWRPAAGQRLLCGGESVPQDLAESLLEDAPAGLELWNVYGPTETTIWSAIDQVRPGEPGPPSIGLPIDNTQIRVLDESGRLAPAGVPGELWIGGAGVARGYWRRPDLTAERFQPDPFDGGAGGVLYRTGDLARWRPDGRLDCLGRLDSQVKLRGHRVELGDVEAALTRHPAIAAAAVRCVDDPGGAWLAAYYVVRNDITQSGAEPLQVDQLRAALSESLPEYMIPTAFVPIDRLPRSPAGKLDRRALPLPNGSQLALSTAHLAPRTPLERQIAAFWEELLGREQVGVRDNFFELGGHSLKATQLLSRLEESLGVRLEMARFFERPTVEGLATDVLLTQGETGPDEEWERMLQELEGMSEDEALRRMEAEGADPKGPRDD